MIDDQEAQGHVAVEATEGDEPAAGRRSFLRTALAGVGVPALAMGLAADAHADGPPVRTLRRPTRPTRPVRPARPSRPRVQPLAELTPGWNARNFGVIREDENQHVATIRELLGSAARPKPIFQNLQQASPQAFAGTSRLFENLDAAAYLGVSPLIQSREILAAATSIALIDARHAGWLNSLLNVSLILNVQEEQSPLELPLTPELVAATAAPFIADLNGGPPLLPLASDVDILNFALVLEHLAAEFYNINVPLFFGA